MIYLDQTTPERVEARAKLREWLMGLRGPINCYGIKIGSDGTKSQSRKGTLSMTGFVTMHIADDWRDAFAQIIGTRAQIFGAEHRRSTDPK